MINPSKGIFAHIRNRILAGIFVVVPLIVTLWLSAFIYVKMTEWAVHLFSESFPITGSHFWLKQSIRVITLVLIVVILFFVGELTGYKLGRWVISTAELILLKLPILNTIYSTCRQIGEAIWAPSGNMFRKVVLFEYPRKGIYVIGFLTNENNDSQNEMKLKSGEDLISIFLPTTPNPTSGFLLFVPRKDCIFLDTKIADAMRLIISGGAINYKQPDSHGTGEIEVNINNPSGNISGTQQEEPHDIQNTPEAEE
jgi:uncharacterized membrane protein